MAKKIVPVANTVKKERSNEPPGFALDKQNYKLMAIGLGVIVLGFILMAGGGTDDPKVFNNDIFSFRRITLAPVVLLAGFIFEIYAIMKRPGNKKPINN